MPKVPPGIVRLHNEAKISPLRLTFSKGHRLNTDSGEVGRHLTFAAFKDCYSTMRALSFYLYR